ncbi:hypothetical protein JANAI62_23970 [Jannaschia pagri]|uniref:Activator of Hsp90 ATPase homologue 1/2-like C-terminal domain-containing protein n=2 Tax=Roseobacteraceae TaxID=2854170 RepID=A0ABQ4NNI3_9RHOB|nr:hypothetical protein JANAI61_23980 [Jannaschia sp. AI_61]GIT95774.1 hypothetical protein JANAI62_23970 [Jannaschia sp. AI_62]
MSRFGVAKHLKVLDDAGLVTRVKRGRFTHHYLNAVPLAEAMARWIEPYRVAPAVRGVLDLKARLEGEMTNTPDFVQSTFIRCSPLDLWRALTDAADISRWHFLTPNVRRDGDLIAYDGPPGEPMLLCRISKEDPPVRLEMTFEIQGDGAAPPSRVVQSVAVEGAHCCLTLEHFGLTHAVVPGQGVFDGWSRWAAGLKTWLETGEPTRFGAPSTQSETSPSN